MSVKKISNIKSGQRVFRVWGYPVRPQNEGIVAANGHKYHIKAEACLPLGKRSRLTHYDARVNHLLNGSVQNRYFHKKARAEQYVQEILQGMHPWALQEMDDHAIECDLSEDYLLHSGSDIENYTDDEY